MIGPPLCICEFIWTLISSIRFNSSLHMKKTITYMFLVKMVWIGSSGECNLCLDNGWFWGFTVLTVVCITRALCFLFASLNQECLVGFYFKKQGITSMCLYGSCPSQVSKCTWGFYVSNLWSRGTTTGFFPSCCCQRLHSCKF